MQGKEARFYEALPAGFVQCKLCPKFCKIAEGRAGVCLGRVNSGGKLYARSYGMVVSAGMDPIEKKPLYHFHPGANILSVATYGCNLSCPFCQNAEISKQVVQGRFIAPDELVRRAQHEGSFGVSYTYTEPLVWFEYLMDACPLVHEAGMKNVLVTNGMINEAPLRELLPFIDAMNVDLKSIRPEYYRSFLGGDLEAVKNTIKLARVHCHTELTNLIVPTKNDSKEDLEALVAFVASLGRDTVLHFSRYFPHFRLDLPPTPVETLKQAHEIARRKLDYVYVGNVGNLENGNDTRCPGCGNLLIERACFQAAIVGIVDGKCGKCGRKADVVMGEDATKK
jgi:pyruvate formate lyase activating enzyme